MGERKKRTRGSNWNHAHTMALAELKREASLNKEDGPLVWERFAQTLSSRFPGQIRTGAQCRRRWDTLVKVYNYIEDYCVVTGALGHRELDEGELASMKLDTTYQQDWYDIVERVCSQRKRKERCDRDLMLAKRSKDSHFVKLPGRPPNSFSASSSKSVTHHEQSTPESTTTYAQVSSSPSLETEELRPEEEVLRLKNGNNGLMLGQSTTTYAQVSSSPSLEVDKLSPEEEVPWLKNGNDGLLLEVTQLWQLGQVSHEVSQEPQTLESADLLAHTFPVENGAQPEEPLKDDLWDLFFDMPLDTSFEIEQLETNPELSDLFYLKSEGELAPEMPLQNSRLDSGFFSSLPVPVATYTTRYKLHSLPKPTEKGVSARLRRCRTGDGGGGGGGDGGGGELDDRTVPACRLQFGRQFSLQDPVRLRKPRGGARKTSGLKTVIEPAVLSSSTVTSCTFSRSSDSTISRQSRRWSLKVIVLKVCQFSHACGRKERAEDMEMESKQADRLKEKARKKAVVSRKENVPAMLSAASSTSATTATRRNKPSQKDTERISKQAAWDKKEEETRSRKAERQQLRSKSSSKCVPVRQLCAKWRRKLFPAFHGQSPH